MRIERLGGQPEIADRDHPRGPGAHFGARRVAALVAEGVELLDVAEIEPSLGGDEGAHRQLEGAVGFRVEGSER